MKKSLWFVPPLLSSALGTALGRLLRLLWPLGPREADATGTVVAFAAGVATVLVGFIGIMWMAMQVANPARYRALDKLAAHDVQAAASACRDFVDCYRHAVFQSWILCLVIGAMSYFGSWEALLVLGTLSGAVFSSSLLTLYLADSRDLEEAVDVVQRCCPPPVPMDFGNLRPPRAAAMLRSLLRLRSDRV